VSASAREEQRRILREAPARLSLHRFEEERDVVYAQELRDDFVAGYVDGAAGAALERAVDHRSTTLQGERLRAFAFGWCRGHADLLGHRPVYEHVERWLSRRVPSRG